MNLKDEHYEKYVLASNLIEKVLTENEIPPNVGGVVMACFLCGSYIASGVKFSSLIKSMRKVWIEGGGEIDESSQ